MNALQMGFAERRAAGRKALLPFITGGYPDVATTLALLRGLDPQVVGGVEIGIPFSDPIADGPVIQTSFSRALDRGFRLEHLLGELTRARRDIPAPLIAMVSYSIVYRRAPRAFVEQARAAGFDGLIVPDLAIEEAEELAAIGRAAECPLVMIVAPTSTPQRRRQIAALSEPFIYYQSLAGVTGERAALPPDLVAQVRQLRAETAKPICVGFGIAQPEHVRAVCAEADGAIVGSAIVRRLNAGVDRGASSAELCAEVHALLGTLAGGLGGAPAAGGAA
jgi:tryptophan synthase alpha chain